MTPEQLEQSRVEWEAMKPYDLRDKVSAAIWRVIQSGKGDVIVYFEFVGDEGETLTRQTFGIRNEWEKLTLFAMLDMLRQRIRGEYTFKFHVETVEDEIG